MVLSVNIDRQVYSSASFVQWLHVCMIRCWAYYREGQQHVVVEAVLQCNLIGAPSPRAWHAVDF